MILNDAGMADDINLMFNIFIEFGGIILGYCALILRDKLSRILSAIRYETKAKKMKKVGRKPKIKLNMRRNKLILLEVFII